jgi:CBS domain-containing protein
MAKNVGNIMVTNPKILQSDDSALQAASLMRDSHVGCIIVMKGSSLFGIVTDRDLVVRVMAEGKDPEQTRLEEFCSQEGPSGI